MNVTSQTGSASDGPLCRVAVIGAGSMAREHLRAFADVPGVILSGIQSRTRGRAEALAGEFGVIHVCDSVDELYDRTRAHVVVVTVPELVKNVVNRACLKFPWTLLVEKPIGYDLADSEAITEAARAANAAVFVALNRRLYSSTQAAIDDLAGRDGCRFIRVQDQQDQAAGLASGQPEVVVKNWMYANSIHTIDYLRLFGRGPVVQVRPIVPWTPDRPGVVVSEIHFESGDIGFYEGIWDGPGPWAVTVSTASRRWEMRPLETASFQNRGERVLRPVDVHPWDQEFKAGFRRQAALAVNAALGAECAGLATIADALETTRLIARIFGS
jgi:predicted dehydrogenase